MRVSGSDNVDREDEVLALRWVRNNSADLSVFVSSFVLSLSLKRQTIWEMFSCCTPLFDCWLLGVSFFLSFSLCSVEQCEMGTKSGGAQPVLNEAQDFKRRTRTRRIMAHIFPRNLSLMGGVTWLEVLQPHNPKEIGDYRFLQPFTTDSLG